MKLFGIVRELLPLAGVNLGSKRSKTGERIQIVLLYALAWIPLLVWAGVAFYRSTVRKDELLAQREAGGQPAAGVDHSASSPHALA